jgi:hypothetical protein
MLKQLLGVFAFIVGVLAGFIFSVTSSPIYNECIDNRAEENAPQHYENGAPIARVFPASSIAVVVRCVGRFTKENGDAITAVATVLLTIVTGLLGWVAYQQFTTNECSCARTCWYELHLSIILGPTSFPESVSRSKTSASLQHIKW